MNTDIHQTGRHRGFTLFELIVVISIISVLFVFAAERLMKLAVQAERASVQQMTGIIRSALAMRIAAHVARGTVPELAALANGNPMDLLADTPDTYLGELDHPDPATIEGGHWYFDTRTHLLVYRVLNEKEFETRLPGPKRIRWRLEPVFEDRNGNGRFDPDRDTLVGLKLAAQEKFKWRVEPADIRPWTTNS